MCLKWHRDELRKKEYEAIKGEIQNHKWLTHKEIIIEVSKNYPEKKVIEVLREMIDFGF